MPGAVPLGFARTVAPSGTCAWRRLRGVISRPRRANRSWIACQTVASSIKRQAEKLGGDFPGDIVSGRAEAAGDDNDIRARQGLHQRLADGLAIRDGDLPGDSKAQGEKFLPEEARCVY